MLTDRVFRERGAGSGAHLASGQVVSARRVLDTVDAVGVREHCRGVIQALDEVSVRLSPVVALSPAVERLSEVQHHKDANDREGDAEYLTRLHETLSRCRTTWAASRPGRRRSV